MTEIGGADLKPRNPEPRETGHRDSGHGAGQDPEKRSQILAGARRVFFERGFDAASTVSYTHLTLPTNREV